MHDFSKRLSALNGKRPFRYLVSGCVATGVHFVVLVFCMQVLNWSSAGAANGIAAIFGITTSFVGNRYYVFKHSIETAASQIVKFLMLYLCIALLHAGVLLVWADYYQLNYAIGFFMATLMQLTLSYCGNKVLVFKV